MCGITGIFHSVSSGKSIDHNTLKAMCDVIAHRGPDDEGFYIDEYGKVALGHRRLSIIDLAGGAQPMSNADGNLLIVFNGEIYNFHELKKELIARGCHFKTSSDTEVILYLYQEYGEKSFERLNGIFAFAIYDSKKKNIILARDHFGVKPLYYIFRNGTLIFGSEIKSILAYTDSHAEMDYDALHSFLTFRYNPSPQTLFKNIKKLEPGYFFKITFEGQISHESYWSYTPTVNSTISENEAIEEYQRLLENAVERQMVSDVPVGLMLSGGVDSAVLGYLMQKNSGEKIKTFTIGFSGEGDYNELADAKKSAEFIGSEHFEMTLSRKDYIDFFSRSFYYTEEPIAETTIPALYYISKLASQHLKVVLAGQGADEPLAGYHRYIGEKFLSRFSDILSFLPLNSLVKLISRNERLKRAAFASQFSTELDRFLAIYTIFTPAMKEKLLKSHVKTEIHNNDRQLLSRLYDESSSLRDSLNKILFIDSRMSLSDDLLLFGDKMSMANSLEMRVPFLDVELVKFLESLPSDLKLKGRVGKYIHKKAVKKWLPDEIIYRKKRGFSTPMDEWLQTDLAISAKEIFNAPDAAVSKYFNVSYINELIDRHQSRKENYQRHIFALLSFEIWHQTFIDGKTPVTLE
jgi:asparagine synthase (glutamine-hydrolysing)